MNYSIGEFSRITRVSVKALRLYHDKDLLVPDFVDPESGYRYYATDQVSEVRVIQALKEMGFSLAEIKETLDDCEDDGDLVGRLEEKRREMEIRMRTFRRAMEEIESVIRAGRELREGADFSDEIEEKMIPDMLVCGYRMKGRYEEIGKGFGKVMRHAGRHAVGKPMSFFYDGEYKDEDADFEAALPVSKELEHEDLDTRVMEGGRALTIVHRGPYERLGESYQKLFDVVKREGVELVCPSREIYLKGPGMILRGNPAKYLTEIQFFVAG